MRWCRLHIYDVTGQGFSVWVVAESRDAADAVMHMEYTGKLWRFRRCVTLSSMSKSELRLVDHWVGGLRDDF